MTERLPSVFDTAATMYIAQGHQFFADEQPINWTEDSCNGPRIHIGRCQGCGLVALVDTVENKAFGEALKQRCYPRAYD